MRHKFHTVTNQKTVKFLFLLTLIFCLCNAANAQRRQSDALTYGGGGGGDPDPNAWGLSVSGGYETLTGDAGSGFKGAPVISLSLTRNNNNFTYSFTMGYASHNPKSDTSNIDIDGTTFGYIKYGNFNTFQVYGGVAYNIPIADEANLYLGLNAGEYASSMSYSVITTEDTESGDFSGIQAFVAPKVGINFLISPHASFAIEAKYNFIQSSSSTTSSDAESGTSYSYSVGAFKSYTVSGAFNFYF
jgi:hypothetical protein